jgi:hypothetical protein
LPLEPWKNTNWNAEQYEQFFRETVSKLQEQHGKHRVEICGIICDNLPAQVAGLRNFLSSEDGLRTGIFHIPCLNHMVNLVFVHAIKDKVFAEAIADLPGQIHLLNKAQALEIINCHCPKLIKTRWVYLVDILGFILHHLDAVQTALAIAEAPQITETYGLVYLVLLPLALVSRAMEDPTRTLGEVIPAAQEVLREWSEIWSFFRDQPAIREWLDIVTAHFLARLRRNSFEVIQTAFALTPTGRAQIREREVGFQTKGFVGNPWELEFVSKMRDQFSGAMQAHQLLNSARPAEVPRVAERMEELDPLDPDDVISETELPDTTDTFVQVLEQEASTPIEERLNRDLLAGVLQTAQEQIVQLCQPLGYPPDDIVNLFHKWWQEADVGDHDLTPDDYWREYHGQSTALGRLAHIALRFVTLGCSEADIERLLSEQKHLQGIHGTNYRMDTLQAREVLRETRPRVSP